MIFLSIFLGLIGGIIVGGALSSLDDKRIAIIGAIGFALAVIGQHVAYIK